MKTLLFLTTLAFSVSSYALEQGNYRTIIDEGINTLQKHTIEAAWKFWAKNTPLENTEELNASATQFAAQISNYGKYKSHDYVTEKNLGPNNKIVYFVMNFEKGPIFAKFNLFKKTDEKWLIPVFAFNKHVEKLWPSSIYAPIPSRDNSTIEKIQ